MVVSWGVNVLNKLRRAVRFKIALQSGQTPMVNRQAIGATTCAWCRGKVGTYEDPDPEVFARHASCDCKIFTSGYKTRNGLLDNYKKPKK